MSDLTSFLRVLSSTATRRLLVDCLRRLKVGVGSRDGGTSSLVGMGSRACDLDSWSLLAADFLALLGRGRLLNVLLLGMPPTGSSGRQM